ncbi:MAG: BppU family phage baseplate upper protein [Peptoniphilus lacydonensis]|uniref:BppU family phage baseplate upper protein n=1 Tax=Peptoniphilus lacydonensis TaxID=1673725 RepID=UPI00258B50CA|nr:BppU family phage baseplate upper protein [Peptoniphilus lacydonensis]MDU7302125.1 BppU family phage baseplate upper protein [Peptoniphilus lacydonensis]
MVNNEIIKLKFDNSFNGRLFATQGDTGRVFNLQVFDDYNKPVDVTGMKLRMYVANSKEVSYSEGEIVEDVEGKIKVQVYNSQLKYPGKQKTQFILTDKDGQKIGSKIFDLWIEEGLEAGPTVGRNIYVDFEKINEALDLIKDYDKTLEEAKEVDASLKVGINEGIEARNNLADCKKKALEIKDQLDKSKVDANKTLDDLKTTKTESETLKSDLSLENQKATENFNGLNTKIEEGKTTTSELNTNIENAKTNKENLDKSNTTALATKKSLEDATDAANTTKTELGSLKNQGDTLSEDLASKITEGKSLKSNLDTNISNAKNVKSNLDTSVGNATSTNTTLKATDTEAKKTEALIKDLMSQLGKSENEVKQIIASGDLSKYITEPKLQEALKSYATKEDLQGIDVTGQLGDYAKKTDVPTKLSELQSDTNNRTVTDAEKNKLENIEDGAEKNKITSVNQKTGDVVLKISDLENDKNFKTEVEIQELINNSTKLKKEVVTSLPSTGKEDIIYLLKNKADTNNYYTEYMWISGKWEIIGDTKVDLSEYLKTVNLSSTKLRTNKSNTNVFTDRSTSDHQLDIILGDLELRTEQNKKNIENIQEFTQQELEEAFK